MTHKEETGQASPTQTCWLTVVKETAIPETTNLPHVNQESPIANEGYIRVF